MRLIDVSHAIKLLRKIRNDYPADSVKHKMLNMVISILANPQQTPTVDAAPVVHGRWEPELMPTGVEYSGYQEMTVQALSCSVCGKCIDVSEGLFFVLPQLRRKYAR